MRNHNITGFAGSINSKVSGASGNANIFKNVFSTQNIYKTEKQEFIFFLNQEYGEASRLKNTNNGSSHIRYSQRLSKKLLSEFFGQLEYNEFKQLTSRRLLGAGLRFEILKNELSTFVFGSGIFQEKEKLRIDSDQENFRGNIYLSYGLKSNERLESIFVFYYQPSAQLITDYRIQADLGLSLAATKNLKLTLELNYATDTKPPQGVKTYDVSYLSGLSYAYDWF